MEEGTMRSLLTAVVVGTVCFAGLSFGQATDGIIVGKVTDPSGSAVIGAAVTATNKDTNVKYSSPTNEAGDYRLNNLPVGQYDVTATAQGFATATVARVQLELNHITGVNLTLSVGKVTTEVDVTEATALIDTATSQVQNTFNATQAIDVPSASFSSLVRGICG
jgi:hypothetical protein